MAFSASYDRFTKIVSAVLCLVMVFAIFASHNIVVSTLALGVMLVSFAYSPRGYILSGRSIAVRRLAGPVRIPLEDVREVRRATADDLSGCIRLWGSGGLFGYYGLFSSSKLGKFTEYATSRENAVLVVSGSKNVIFSPDDVDGFMASIRAAAPVQASNPVPAPAFDTPRRFGSFGRVAAIAVGLAAVGIAVAANLYSPGPPAYTLTPEALTIHDRFYPVTLRPDTVNVSQVRMVDLAADPDWKPTARTNGFANSHYQSGWFQVANGQKVRLYRAGGSRLVLLPPKGNGAAVLYQAPDSGELARAIRAAWMGK